jgi:hypothetical protein
MTVTAPPRSPYSGDPVGPDLDDTDVPEAGVPEALIEEARRRARRRRRITGAVLVVAVAAVVALVAIDGGPPSQDSTAASAAGSGGPVAAGSDRANLIATWSDLHEGWILVYDGGLVLWWPHDYAVVPPIFQRRLTPEGVDLVGSGAVELRRLPPLSHLMRAYAEQETMPQDKWADGEASVWVATEFAACPQTQFGEIQPLPSLGQFPDPVQTLLAGKQKTYNIGDLWEEPRIAECFALTSEDAHTLVELGAIHEIPGGYETVTYETIGYETILHSMGLNVDFEPPDGETVQIGIWPVLPHGEFLPGPRGG